MSPIAPERREQLLANLVKAREAKRTRLMTVAEEPAEEDVPEAMPGAVVYFVAPTEEMGIADAQSRGWAGIARLRYITQAKNDVRIVSRASEMVPFGGRTPMMRCRGYKSPKGLTQMQRAAWERNREEFDRFVVEGNGIWVWVR